MRVREGPFGAFLDCAYYGNYADARGSVRHLGDDEYGMGARENVDESVNIYPGMLDPKAAAVVFVITPAKYKSSNGGKGTNLPDDMFVTVSVQNPGDATAKELARTEIAKTDRRAVGAGGAIVASVFYRDGDGAFHVRHDYKVTGRNTWGGIIPLMKQELKSFLIPDIVVDPTEQLAVLRKASAYPVDDLRRVVDRAQAAAAEERFETQAGAGIPAASDPKLPAPGGLLPVAAGETPDMLVKQVRFDLGRAPRPLAPHAPAVFKHPNS